MNITNSSSMTATIDKTIVSAIYDGREFKFVHSDPSDHLLAAIRDSGTFYEAELLSILVPLVPPGATIVDIGANIGNHSVFFAGVMGCLVIAIEPNPAAAALLEQNLDLNGLADRVTIWRCAIGADRRKGRVTDGDKHNMGTAGVVSDPEGVIEFVPLDALDIEGGVALVKVDVEGGEYDVLSGATTFLDVHKPILVLEIALERDYRRIAEFLEPFGYVPAGSYNYTPTHIFRVRAGERAAAQLIEIGHGLALRHIATMDQVASISHRLAAVRLQVEQLSGSEMSKAERQDGKQRECGRKPEATARIEAFLNRPTTDATGKAKAVARKVGNIASELADFSSTIADFATQLKAVTENFETAGVQRVGDSEMVSVLRISIARWESECLGRIGALTDRLADIVDLLETNLAEIGSSGESNCRRRDHKQ